MISNKLKFILGVTAVVGICTIGIHLSTGSQANTQTKNSQSQKHGIASNQVEKSLKPLVDHPTSNMQAKSKAPAPKTESTKIANELDTSKFKDVSMEELNDMIKEIDAVIKKDKLIENANLANPDRQKTRQLQELLVERAQIGGEKIARIGQEIEEMIAS